MVSRFTIWNLKPGTLTPKILCASAVNKSIKLVASWRFRTNSLQRFDLGLLQKLPEAEDTQVYNGEHYADQHKHRSQRRAEAEVDIAKVIGERTVISVQRPRLGCVVARPAVGQ